MIRHVGRPRERRYARFPLVDIGLPGCHDVITRSSSTLNAMLASNGDRMPPCGVPVQVSPHVPSA
jgi:hypothetical protein